MINISKIFKNHSINCCVIKMGNDLNVCIYGGDSPHIGAVSLGIPRPSLELKNKISSSVSLITVTGHKEDVIVQKAAKYLASSLNSIVVVSCGIHIDNLTFEDLKILDVIIDEILYEIVLKAKIHK